jgi:hypothetical protein
LVADAHLAQGQLLHHKRQIRNITNITASTANKLGSDVFTGKLAPTRGQHKPAGYDQERQLGLQICPDISPIIIIQFNSIYLCAKLNSPEANYKVSTGKKMRRVRRK